MPLPSSLQLCTAVVSGCTDAARQQPVLQPSRAVVSTGAAPPREQTVWHASRTIETDSAAQQPMSESAALTDVPHEVIDLISDDEADIESASPSAAAAAVPAAQLGRHLPVTDPLAARALNPRPDSASTPPHAAVPLPTAAHAPLPGAILVSADPRPQSHTAALEAEGSSNAAHCASSAAAAPGAYLLTWTAGENLDVPPGLAAAALASSDQMTVQPWVRIEMRMRTEVLSATGTAFMFPIPQRRASLGPLPLRYDIQPGRLMRLLNDVCKVDTAAPVQLLIKPRRVISTACITWLDIFRLQHTFSSAYSL